MNVVAEEGASGIEATTPSSARRPEPGQSGHEREAAETRMNTIWETADEPRVRSASMASRGSTTRDPTVAYDNSDAEIEERLATAEIVKTA
eukprot:10048296-Heterocapsa_arctica.AAC.1